MNHNISFGTAFSGTSATNAKQAHSTHSGQAPVPAALFKGVSEEHVAKFYGNRGCDNIFACQKKQA